jgi:hypothetical protein
MKLFARIRSWLTWMVKRSQQENAMEVEVRFVGIRAQLGRAGSASRGASPTSSSAAAGSCATTF